MQNQETELRQIRGLAMISKGDNPIVLGNNLYLVPSQSSDNKYTVNGNGLWSCECMDYKNRKQDCKHIHAVRIWLALRDKIKNSDTFQIKESIFEKPTCAFCHSFSIMKHGKRKCENMVKQRHLCKDCKKTFIEDKYFKKFKGDAKIITLVMDLYFKGLSLRKIQNHLLQFYDFKVNHETIRNWILRFTSKIAEYVDNLQPNLSTVWHADEMAIKSKGKQVWVWNVLDESTRFLIANNVTDGRNIKEARQVFKKAKENVSAIPIEIITDGLPSYSKAIRKEFKSSKQIGGTLPVKHTQYESIRENPHNNKIERYHGTAREKDKLMRGWKGNNNSQKLLDGYRAYYNFVRPHQALDGLTPSEASGIKIQNRNKWLGLIKTSMDSTIEKKPIKKVIGYEIKVFDKEGKPINKKNIKTFFTDRKKAEEFVEFYNQVYSELQFIITIIYK
ncbi:IS6 family transposase [Candidatus Woesearchaeota archaeon]|nr:IS6 family transposase [Candidatus Aenigmarchaeota archaeon]MBI2647615.1 IS6 family transposase [Candidatus Woesearchaeota archaeon]